MLSGRYPTREEAEYMDAAIGLGCIVCLLHHNLYTPAEFHHLAGKTAAGAHLNGIPLCYYHHRSGVDDEAMTSRHPHKRRFEARYGTEPDLHKAVLERLAEKDFMVY